MKNEKPLTLINCEDDIDLKPSMPKKIAQRFEDLPSNWKEKFYDLALDGASDITMYTSVALTRRQHESLLKHTPVYEEWFEYCSEVSKAWWIDFARKVCLRKDYNSATYSLVMRNRLGWISGDPKVSTPLDIPHEQHTASEPVKTIEDFKPKTEAPSEKQVQ